MKTYKYQTLELVCDNTIKNDWINQLNNFLELYENQDYKVHSILNQGHDNNKTYWKTILLEKSI